MAEDWRAFGIGLNKTGTTSLRLCFRRLGIGPAAPMDDEFRRPLLKALFSAGDYEPALRAARDYRAFDDRPWNVWEMYRHLDRRYPDSRFILTVRDPAAWWRSVDRWLRVTKPGMERRYRHHLRTERLDEESVLAAYHRYNREVRAYFADRPGKLLVVEVAQEPWKELCAFLERPVPDAPFPHSNRQEYDERDRLRFPERQPG